MFEITGDDIAALNDEDLRTLVGNLCEAELRRRNLPSSAVTWGGDQTAKDGGIDVRVALALGTSIDGFIPKANTGYQIKKQYMPPSEINGEMRPKGVVRPVIGELAMASGAYIIVSSADSTSDSALKDRRVAMAESVRDIAGAENLILDFYDCNRIATWVRGHAGLIPWTRSRIGKSIPGWRPYGSWSYAPDGADPTYLVDEAARIKTGDEKEGDGLTATNGINKIRDVLRTPGHVVRLVGLSGVGKTRLVEALFDSAVGSGSLDPSLAIYTNIAEGPDPQPAGLASDLIAGRTRAILVIDNCPPDIHRQLSDIARSARTTISVITVEYDIREDQPEGTEVFVLDTSSVILIETLISKRFPNLSQIDARTIAEFSGGNARVALALAGTVAKNETIAGLSDADLFRRLFQQRHDPDASLQSIAQVCSLVYSFEGEKVSGDGAELPILGGLIGKSAEEVFRAVAELKRRDLVQQRGPWRAVLPHAIANRLAAIGLENIPRSKLLSVFIESAPERLLRSFSRRLGYLDGSREAQAIVQSWLAPGGILSDVTNLTELGRAMFDNVAPVMPDAVLSVLEKVFVESDEATLRKCTHFLRLLRSLAFDPVHFERAVSLLVAFARLPSSDLSNSDAANIIESLFYIVLSGTHAPLKLRLSLVERLLRSSDPVEQGLGVKALQAMLKTSHFSSTYEFEFGARSRDYGYYPPTRQDVRDWFTSVLRLAEPFALLENPVAELVRKAIAREFRGLWTDTEAADELERLAYAVATEKFWREGWIAARHTRIYEGKGLPPKLLARLTALEKSLKPENLIDKVRGLVLGSNGGGVDLDELNEVENDGYDAAASRVATAVENLGRDVATDEQAFKVLLPELIDAYGKVVGFGQGMALEAEQPREMWSAMVAQVTETGKPGIDLLCGFLDGLQKRDGALANALLDEALDDPTLAAWLPTLQAGVRIDEDGLRRLHRALELGKAPIDRFFGLAYGRTCDVIPGSEFKRLMLSIGQKPGGVPVAMDILAMRMHSDRSGKKAFVPEVAEAGRELLRAYEFHRKDNRATREDYEIGVIVRVSLAGEEGKAIAQQLCRNLMAAAARYEVHAYDHDDLLKALFQVHPVDVLDELFSGDRKSQDNSIRLLNDVLRFGKTPIDAVSDEVMLGWCDREPKDRYRLAAAVALLFKRPNDNAPHEWTSLTHQLLMKAPDPEAVFKEVVKRLRPTGWSGSLATKLESRLTLLIQLDVSAIPTLAAPLDSAKSMLKQCIEIERRRETEEDKARSGRFE
ncbi:MAG: hypothetical protein HYR63_27260 [Proteobacteria bacterium]|nr:hypothetical protein [Pseudomonadota bacterium]MBI3498331.1 hypothetical protein [Pseudomonadota bacterium]